MKTNESSVSHVHLIKCQYVGPTATRCSKVKLTSQRFGDSVSTSYDDAWGSSEQGLKILQYLGFTVLSTAETWKNNGAYLECNWFTVKEFESLKDMEAGTPKRLQKV